MPGLESIGISCQLLRDMNGGQDSDPFMVGLYNDYAIQTFNRSRSNLGVRRLF